VTPSRHDGPTAIFANPTFRLAYFANPLTTFVVKGFPSSCELKGFVKIELLTGKVKSFRKLPSSKNGLLGILRE